MDNITNVGSWLIDAPWRGREVSLIFVSADGTSITQEHTLTGKRAINATTESGVMLATWHGHYRTDVRRMSDADRAAVARVLA